MFGKPVWERRSQTILASLAVAIGLTACDSPGGTPRQALTRAWFDSSGTWVHAGISTRLALDLEPLRPETLAGDTLGTAYHLLHMRCGSCHEVPDPSMKTGEHWSYLIGRMQENTRTAGLIPMTDAEADTILGFLRKHARR